MPRFSWFPSKPATTGAAVPGSEAGDLLRQVAGGTLNYGVGQALPLVIGFLLIPVYTSVLTPEDYGIIEMSVVLGGLLSVVMRLGVPGAVTRFYYDHSEGVGLRDYVTSVAWFLRLNALVVGLLACVLAYFFIDALIPGLRFFPYVVLTVAAAVLATNSDLQRRLVQVRRQSSYSAKLSVANSTLGILLAITFVVGLKWGATGMLVAQVVTGAVFLVNATLYLRPDLKGTVRTGVVRESVAYGSGIFTSHLMAGAGPLISRSLLAGAASISAVGLFALASRITSPLLLLSQAFSTAYVPEYFAARKSGSQGSLRALAKVESTFWTMGVQGSLAAAVLGPPVILLLTPARFHPAASLVPVLALGFLAHLLYVFMSPEMFYVKRKWLPPLVTAANLAVTLPLTIVLVGPYGAHGVAWASIAGSLAGTFTCGFVGARRAPVPHDWVGLSRALGVSVGTAVIVSSFPTSSPMNALLLGIAAVILNGILLCITGDSLMQRLLTEVQARLTPQAGVIK